MKKTRTLIVKSNLDTMFRQELPLSDIPNIAGFKFNGILKNGLETPCEVYKRTDGSFTVGSIFTQLRAWTR